MPARPVPRPASGGPRRLLPATVRPIGGALVSVAVGAVLAVVPPAGAGPAAAAPSAQRLPSAPAWSVGLPRTRPAPPVRPPVTPPVTPPSVPPPASTGCSGSALVPVSGATQLSAALASAGPGTTVVLAPGTYAGRFVLSRSGTPAAPVRVCGPSTAVLDAGGTSSGYGLHLDRVADVQVLGLTVRNAQKGVMVDGGSRVVLSGLLVERIGDEAIHLRRHTVDSVVVGSTVRDTGLRKPAYGEGIYVGTAESNWGTVTGGLPDRSDRNRIERNTISRTTAEAVDVKEGTTGGVVTGNAFDGAGLTGADSWVDIKGNDWQVTDNVGTTSPQDGFQTHEILDGWGRGTVFARNVATVGGAGYAIYVHRPLGTVVRCDNVARSAAKGLSNLPCS